ncbi:hemicentin-2-like [Schistocerca nitens]|uniref:hemicentin-2-like n=1 Tax=Schistocerca nitens TaxID=7011 RepID=UPI0021198F8A|nr:hemicentin-2-like [Schistocerca nitens]
MIWPSCVDGHIVPGGSGSWTVRRCGLCVCAEPPRSLRLTVDGEPWNGTEPWLQLEEGARLRLGCEPEGGVPAPQLTWWLTPAPPPDPEETPRGAVPLSSAAGGGARVALLDAVGRQHHNATVSCLARHQALRRPLRADLTLHVRYSPSFAISRLPDFGFPLREGMAVSLKCDVDANPPSSPKWLRDGEEPPVAQTGDGFLNFSYVRREHSGWYKCTSRGASSIGYFLNVRASDPAEEDSLGGSTPAPGSAGGVAPSRGSLERQLEVPLGSTVTLQCPGGGASCWSRLGSPPEPVGAGPDLTIERVLYQEAGAYRCEPALHDASHLTVNLSVRGVPVVYPPWRNVTAPAGLPVTLDVEFCANPAADRALWLLRGALLRPGEAAPGVVAHNVTEANSPHCQYASLTLTSAQPEDAGEYVFLVRSPRGLAEGAFSLQVTPSAAAAPAPAPTPSPGLIACCALWLVPALAAAFRRLS